jgi:hypothetical protein
VPAAKITMAAPSNVTAAPIPTNSVLLIALRKKNALANTVSTMPTVKMNSARPIGSGQLIEGLAATARIAYARPPHQRQREQHVQQRQQPRQAKVPFQVLLWRHLRLLSGGEEHHQAHCR